MGVLAGQLRVGWVVEWTSWYGWRVGEGTERVFVSRLRGDLNQNEPQEPDGGWGGIVLVEHEVLWRAVQPNSSK